MNDREKIKKAVRQYRAEMIILRHERTLLEKREKDALDRFNIATSENFMEAGEWQDVYRSMDVRGEDEITPLGILINSALSAQRRNLDQMCKEHGLNLSLIEELMHGRIDLSEEVVDILSDALQISPILIFEIEKQHWKNHK